MIDHDGSHVGQCFYPVNGVWKNDCRLSGTNDTSLTVYCNLKLTIDHVPDLVVRMRMLMERRACSDRVVAECHVPGMKEPPFPTFPRLFHAQSICVDECHGRLRVSLHFLLNRRSCVNTQSQRSWCFTKTSVARSQEVKSCPMNFPLVVVSPVTTAVFP